MYIYDVFVELKKIFSLDTLNGFSLQANVILNSISFIVCFRILTHFKGPGLLQNQDNIVATKCGILRNPQPKYYWIENRQKRVRC